MGTPPSAGSETCRRYLSRCASWPLRRNTSPYATDALRQTTNQSFFRAYVVGPDNKVDQRYLTLDLTDGDLEVLTKGFIEGTASSSETCKRSGQPRRAVGRFLSATSS